MRCVASCVERCERNRTRPCPVIANTARIAFYGNAEKEEIMKFPPVIQEQTSSNPRAVSFAPEMEERSTTLDAARQAKSVAKTKYRFFSKSLGFDTWLESGSSREYTAGTSSAPMNALAEPNVPISGESSSPKYAAPLQAPSQPFDLAPTLRGEPLYEAVLGDSKCRMFLGDARSNLHFLPKNSFQTVITSPPYFGLRDYGDP
jgi:hypothetical protein